MITFTEIVTCHGTALYETMDKQMSFNSSGKLSVLMAYDGMILLRLEEFEYGINASDEIMYDDKDPQFSFVFFLRKYPEGLWILKVNQNADSLFSCLNEKCYLKNRRGQKNVIKHYQQGQSYSKTVELKEQPRLSQRNSKTEESNSSGWTAKSIAIGASKGLGTGLVFTGKWLSKGFQNLGGFVSSKVTKDEKQAKVEEGTKENINLAVKTTKNILVYTSEQVASLFKFGKNMAADVGQRFQKSDKGKEMQQNQYYESVKQGAKTGGQVISNLYDGVVTAVYEMGSGFSKGATKVIDAKYGQDASKAADGAFEGVGNVAKIARSPYDQAAKAFKSDDPTNQ